MKKYVIYLLLMMFSSMVAQAIHVNNKMEMGK